MSMKRIFCGTILIKFWPASIIFRRVPAIPVSFALPSSQVSLLSLFPVNPFPAYKWLNFVIYTLPIFISESMQVDCQFALHINFVVQFLVVVIIWVKSSNPGSINTLGTFCLHCTKPELKVPEIVFTLLCISGSLSSQVIIVETGT